MDKTREIQYKLNQPENEKHPPYFDPTIPDPSISLDEDTAKNVTNVDVNRD